MTHCGGVTACGDPMSHGSAAGGGMGDAKHDVAPVAETGFSHGLTPYKIVGQFFERSHQRFAFE